MQLREIFRRMIEKNILVGHFDGDSASVQGTIAGIVGMKEAVLALQHELVEQEKRLHETPAGALLGPFLDREEAERIRRTVQSQCTTSRLQKQSELTSSRTEYIEDVG